MQVLKVSYISIFHEHVDSLRTTDPSTWRTAFSVVFIHSVTIDQRFSTCVPQKPNVPRKVTRGSAKDPGGNIYGVFTFPLVCSYSSDDL
jgi:hypothetical protein